MDHNHHSNHGSMDHHPTTVGGHHNHNDMHHSSEEMTDSHHMQPASAMDHMMKMYFHGGYTEVILFDFWRISSIGKLDQDSGLTKNHDFFCYRRPHRFHDWMFSNGRFIRRHQGVSRILDAGSFPGSYLQWGIILTQFIKKRE